MSFVTIIEKLDSITAMLDQISRRIFVTGRPANEIILDDYDLQEMFKVCKRTTAYWRTKELIKYSKIGGKISYRLSAVLAMVQEHEVPSINSTLKIAL
jgi:hypothetical protein